MKRDRAYDQFFVSLCQLAADRDDTVAKNGQEIGQRVANPMRRLEEDDDPRLVAQLLEPAFSGDSPRRWEADEQHLLRLEPGGGDRRQSR